MGGCGVGSGEERHGLDTRAPDVPTLSGERGDVRRRSYRTTSCGDGQVNMISLGTLTENCEEE